MVVHSAAASSVHFDDLARNQHLKFQLRATNNVGASVQATELFLPADLASQFPFITCFSLLLFPFLGPTRYEVLPRLKSWG